MFGAKKTLGLNQHEKHIQGDVQQEREALILYFFTNIYILLLKIIIKYL